MIRVLLLTLALTTGGCITAPIVPDAQLQLQVIAAEYIKARMLEQEHCPPAPQCEQVRRAGYDAESAYVTANGERTAQTINDARTKIAAYAAKSGEL